MAESQETSTSLFSAITGVQDQDIIRAFLEDASWNVEVAVSNFETMQAEEPIVATESSSTSQTAPAKRARVAESTAPQATAAPTSSFSSSVAQGSRAEVPNVDVFRNFSGESGGPVKNLSEMFSPPYDLMFRGNFEEALETARIKKAWLLVNIVNNADFNSHCLNRDTWSNPSVKEFIKSGFIFWQQHYDTPAGQHFCIRYEVPREQLGIYLLDGRTGELCMSLKGLQKPDTLVEKLCDYFARNDMELPQVSVIDMTEEEGKAAASEERKVLDLTESSSQRNTAAPSGGTIALDGAADEGASTKQPDTSYEETSRSSDPSVPWQDFVPKELPPEATDGGARIQLRLPQGKRVVQTFAPTECVGTLYALASMHLEKPHPLAWLYSQPSEQRGKHRTLVESACADTDSVLFDLLTIHPTESLVHKSHQSLETAGLMNAVVVVKMQ